MNNGATGWTVPSGATGELATVILEASRDHARRERLSRAGQERFNNQFSWTRMMQSYRERYAELLTKRV